MTSEIESLLQAGEERDAAFVTARTGYLPAQDAWTAPLRHERAMLEELSRLRAAVRVALDFGNCTGPCTAEHEHRACILAALKGER